MNIIKRIIARFVPRSTLRYMRMAMSPYVLPRSYKKQLARYEKVEKKLFGADYESDFALLRMYGHILDKGLHRPGWTPGKSRPIYDKAKDILDRYAETNDSTVLWARKIINEYETRQTQPDAISPLGEPAGPSPLTTEDLFRQMRHRLSCRQYEDRPVDTASVEKIVEAALESPWSCSRQALRIYSSIAPDTALEALSCFEGFTSFSHAPCVLVFCVDLRSYSMPNELFVPHVDVGLAAAHATLMASSLELSITFLSWGSSTAENEQRLRTLFDIPDHYEIVVGGCCGYPRQNPVRPARKSIAETLIWK